MLVERRDGWRVGHRSEDRVIASMVPSLRGHRQFSINRLDDGCSDGGGLDSARVTG
jgi:hypothetical protein